MGFRAPEEVPPTFLVTGTGGQFSTRHQALGVRFDGFRRDVQVDEIIAAEGRRTPDQTVAQRRFRFAFVLVVPPGAPVPAGTVEQLDTYRRAFQDFYGKAASGRATADTRLRLAMDFSAFPAAGVVAGRQMQARLQVKKPAAAPLAVTLKSLNGAVAAPAGVTIPAGSTSVTFSLTGMRAGVDEVTAEPADARYDSAVARIQVQADLAPLQMRVESGDKQGGTAGQPLPLPVVVSVRDVNRLAYSGISLTATPSGGGSVAPQTASTDENGMASFQWTPGAPHATLAIHFAGTDQGGVDVTSSTGRSFANPVNAASFDATLAPGSIASVFGANLTSLPAQSAKFPWPLELAGVRVQIGGKSAAILFAGPSQINFLVPDDVPPGPAALTIVSDGQTSTRPAAALVAPTAPGIFFDINSGYGAILTAGTSSTTRDRPVAAGDVIEIYATGLGAVAAPDASGLRRTQSAVEVTIGDRPAQVLFSGLTPGYLGLYQVNAVVPDGLSPGGQPVSVSVNGVRSNLVSIGVR